MFKFARKNSKLIGVVFGVILMVMFLSQMAPQGTTGQSNALQKTVATLDGQKVSLGEIHAAAAKWQILRSLNYLDLNSQSAEPQRLLAATTQGGSPILFGADLAEQIEQSQKGAEPVPLFYLLTREADRSGIVVSPEEVETLVTSHVFPAGEPGTEEREQVLEAVADGLKIGHLIDRTSSVIKISQPYQQYQLARMFQTLTVKILWMSAASYSSQVPNPTDAQIDAQYKQYSDRTPARPGQVPSQFGNTEDPLGFGYKTPNKVQVQYIGLNYNDVHQAAIASKSEEDWYVAAFAEFQKNRDDYDGRPVTGSPATRPASTAPSDNGAQKLTDIKADFALHVPMVLEQLYNDQTQTLQDQVLKEINGKLATGYGTYRDVVASGAKPETGAAADYISFNFIQDLAKSISTKYAVTPITGNIQQFKSIDELEKLEGIGRSAVQTGTQQLEWFPNYAIDLFQPWMSDAVKNSPIAALAISQWQPSNPVHDGNRNYYVFRISGSEASHLPPVAEVKDQVVADIKTAAGYAKALDAAQALLASAAQRGLESAASAAHLPAPVLTDPFNPMYIAAGRSTTIAPLSFSVDSIRELAKQSQQLLITPASAGHRPQLLAQLYGDRIAAVIALNSAQPSWDEQDKANRIAVVEAYLKGTAAEPLTLSLFTGDAVKSRMNFVPLEKLSD